MTPRERMAAIATRSSGHDAFCEISNRDAKWLLARLKRAEDLLREWQEVDSQDGAMLFEASIVRFLDGSEDDTHGR
jgi:hypothetical protein